MDLRGKRIEEGYTNLVTVEGDSVASSGKLQNGQGTDLGNIAVGGLSFNSGDGELQLPAGTTAERPASPSAGYARFNTDKGKVEIYTGAAWLSIALEGAVQLEAATATVTANDAVAALGGFIPQFGTPASAFSVRKLGDTDVCMRVRRSSDNAEQNIGFDGDDLDETALTTFVGANDGFVTTWYDQSVDNSTLPAEHGGGATASYSLRLVDSTYTGDAIRVRRSSDNAEQDIGFVDGELDTSSLETFCSGTNGFVTTWYDQSGSNDATQATAGSQPQIVSSGSTILENGKPALDFDGSDDVLTASGVGTNDDMLISFVADPDGSNEKYMVSIGYDSSDSLILFNQPTTNYYESITDNVVINSTSGFTAQNVASYSKVSNNIELFLGGSSIGSSSSGTTISSNTLDLELGYAVTRNKAGTYYDGTMQEFIYYSSDQSANRESIELNQASYYDIGVSIGATQSTAGSQPKIVSSGSVIKENSQPSISATEGDSLNISSLTLGNNASIFAVIKNADQTGSGSIHRPLLAGGDSAPYVVSSTAYALGLSRDGSDGVRFTNPSTSGAEETLVISLATDNTMILISGIGAGGTANLYVDGGSNVNSSFAERTTGFQSSYILFSDGTGRVHQGGASEFIIYNSDKSSDRTSIESNIATYYNITI